MFCLIYPCLGKFGNKFAISGAYGHYLKFDAVSFTGKNSKSRQCSNGNGKIFFRKLIQFILGNGRNLPCQIVDKIRISLKDFRIPVCFQSEKIGILLFGSNGGCVIHSVNGESVYRRRACLFQNWVDNRFNVAKKADGNAYRKQNKYQKFSFPPFLFLHI